MTALRHMSAIAWRSQPRMPRWMCEPGRCIAAMGVLLAVAALTGCEKSFENMYNQPRYKPLAASPLWPDGRASRTAPAGTVAHGEGAVAGTSSGRAGATPVGPEVAKPVPLAARDNGKATGESAERPANRAAAGNQQDAWTMPVLARGQQRFNIYCAPCHSEAGDGDGMVARRGFPHPPSFHIDRLRREPDDYFYSVITHGYGDMYSYADRVPPDDRRAIIGYIRALQRSQNARLDDVPAEARSALEAAR